MTVYLIQALSGLSHAATLFLVASGLSIIFGVTRIVNFAHGSFYMLGAYMAYSFSEFLSARLGVPVGFWTGIVLAALAVGLIGVLLELTVLRRIYGVPELYQLLATFGVVLLVQDVALLVWGREDLLAPRAPGLRGTVEILGQRFPQYHLFVIALYPLVMGLLWLLFRRTRWGTLVRAATEDREMTGALGVNQRWLFTSVVLLGSCLAGLGGALQIPKEAVNLQMDLHIITEAFVVVVIGGLGSIAGAFLAALLVGEISAFGILWFPQSSLVLPFLVMAVVLVVRPYGLLGKPERQRGAQADAGARLRPGGRGFAYASLTILLALAAVPLFSGTYTQLVLSEIFVLALFAASLHFILSVGGMISFGHAAYFGLGAYTAALLLTRMAAPMGGALAAAPVLAAAMALVFGWFCIRLSGVYLAMLTLAFAQILWSLAVQSGWAGGDNGILGVWPTGWASSKTAYYYVTLGLGSASLLVLRRAVFAPFGYALRAARDSAMRSEAIGIGVRRQQWMAFTLAGAFAGLAGALHAFLKGSVFPTLLSIPQSIDALVMVLLGGLHTLTGPLVGTATYHVLQTEIMRVTDYWRAILGAVIVLLVVGFPEGLVGSLRGWLETWSMFAARRRSSLSHS
ncbi:MAG TPA: ABC transporter permease [Burkholderiales bacterium]|nr:ABC transporter permease [Burkholderiales bacterium]